ncbi:MAG TPA: hypothetical protein VGK74_17005 [Symbiobacteriaceae bacterium]
MKRFLRPLALVMAAVVLLLSGCTGYSLGYPEQMWKLNDLYMASTGVMVHMEAGQFVADTAKTSGALKAGVNLRIPYTRLEADVWALYRLSSGDEWKLWEIKPDKYFFNGQREATITQLKGYVDHMQKADYTVVQTGSGVYYPSPGVPVPDSYTPEAYARCLQIVVVSRPELGQNIVGYLYRWHPSKRVNGGRCKDQDDQTRNQYLAGFAADAAEFVKQKFEHVDPAQMMLAIEAHKTALATIRQQLVDVMTYDDDPDNAWIDPGTTRAKTHMELMKYEIPIIFRVAPDPAVPFPGIQRDNGDSWECTDIAC